jgi:hypothetical protein
MMSRRPKFNAIASTHHARSELGNATPVAGDFTWQVWCKDNEYGLPDPNGGEAMTRDYVFLCGVMWSQYASEDAGHELVRALHSEDPYVAFLAYAFLEEPEVSATVSRL